MQKYLKTGLLHLLAFALIALSVTAAIAAKTTTTIRAAETPNHVKAIYPSSGYESFLNITDICSENGLFYILEGKYPDSSPKVSVYSEEKCIASILVGLTDPTAIAAFGDNIFVYDSGIILVYGKTLNGYEKLSASLTIGLLTDFSASDGKLFLLSPSLISIYAYDETGFTLSQEITGLNLYKPSAIASSGNYIYYLDAVSAMPRTAIYRYDVRDGSCVKNTEYDRTQPALLLSANAKHIAITTNGYVKLLDAEAFSSASLPVKSLAITPNADLNPGNLLAATSISLSQEDKLYIADSNISTSVQRFTSDLAYDNVSISSFSSAEGKFFHPEDLFDLDGKRYVLDSGNNRLQIFSDASVETVSLPQLTNTSYIKLAVESASSLYVATQNALYHIDGDRTVKIVAEFNQITALFISMNSRLYLSDGTKILQYGEGGAQTVFTAPETVHAIVSDLKDENIYVAAGNRIIRYNVSTRQSAETQLAFSVRDMDIDFTDHLYLLSDANAVTVLKSDLQEEASALLGDIEMSDKTISGAVASGLAIDRSSGELLFNYALNHIVAKLPATVLKATTETDTPKLLPSINVLDKKPTLGNAQPAVILKWPSTVIYPFHDDIKQYETYPAAIAYTQSEKAPENATVLIVEEIDNYYYILYRGKAGFILKNAVNIPTPAPPPYTDALILHSNASVYKYPLTQTIGTDYIFRCASLEKNTPITIIDTVCDFKDANNILWYKIRYDEGKVGYIARENATRNADWDSENVRNAKVRADVNKGTVAVYDLNDNTRLPFTYIKDAQIVKIIKEFDNGWYYIEAEDVKGVTVHGYVEKHFLTNAPLTTAQIVGICLLVAAIVIILAALIIYKVFKKKQKTDLQS